MSAIVICMASAKGGSGKTTLTATFASILTEIGKTVLVIDCDEATHGLTLLYLKEVNDQANKSLKANTPTLGIFDSLDLTNDATESDDDTKSEYFTRIPVGNGFGFIPATFIFSPKPPMSAEVFADRLRIIIKHLRQKYDYIILDAQAGSDVVSEVAIRRGISDEVVIVSEYDPLSAAGIERLKAVMGDNLNYSRTWVLLNKMLPEFVSSFSEFLSVARYLPPIPWTADVVRAYSKRELALDFTIGNQFTLAVMRTLKSLLPHADGIVLDRWASRKAAALRQPIEAQYADQQEKLKYIYSELEKLNSRSVFEIAVSFLVLGCAVVIILSVAIYTLLPDAASRISASLYGLIENRGLTASIAAVLAGLVGLFSSISNLTSKGNYATRRVRREALMRQRDSAEIELKKLEALRIADLDLILKNRKG